MKDFRDLLEKGPVEREVDDAAKQAGINLKNGSFSPKNDAGEDKAFAFISNLKDAGFQQSKDRSQNEYGALLQKGNITVKTNARYGKGYMSILSVKED